MLLFLKGAQVNWRSCLVLHFKVFFGESKEIKPITYRQTHLPNLSILNTTQFGILPGLVPVPTTTSE